MGVALHRARRIRRAIRRTGGRHQVTLRKHNTLQVEGLGSAPALQIAGAKSTGATTITVDAPGLIGKAQKGSQLQIAGDATTYTVQAAVEVVAGKLTLQISPGLAQPAADDAGVTVTQDYGDHLYYARRPEVRESDLALTQVDARVWKVHLEWSPDREPPEHGDFIHDEGRVEYVHDVRPVQPGAQAQAYVLMVGAQT